MRSAELGVIGAVLSLLVTTSTARAQGQPDDATRLAARTLGEAGLKLFESSDYQGALEKFNRALSLVQVPTLGVRSARCLVKLGRLVEASERYREVGAMAIDPSASAAFKDSQAAAQTEAAAERAETLKRIPGLVIGIDGATPADVSLDIDGKPVPSATIGSPRPMDPGPHHVTATRGADVATSDVVLKEGDAQRIVLKLPAIAPTPAFVAPAAQSQPISSAPEQPADSKGSTQRTAGMVVMGVGGASVIVGGITYLIALSKTGNLNKVCPNQQCDAANSDAPNSYNTLRTVSTITFAAGGVLLVGGLIAVLAAPSRTEKHASITPWIGAGTAGLRGAF